MHLPKEKTLGIVLAHGKVADVATRHTPEWGKNVDRLLFFSPTDDPLYPSTSGSFSLGKSKAYSAETNIRCREAMRLASLTRYDYVMVIEYDSLVFGAIPEEYVPPEDGVTAPVFHNADPKFKGKFYLHFPQLFTRTGLELVVAAMDELPDAAEGGFTDRYVGLAVQNAGIPVLDLNPTGFACTHNEIDQIKLPSVLAEYKKGARWSHGIKTDAVFKALRKASFQ